MSTSTTDRPDVRVTHHALQRARERHPDIANLTERRLMQLINREVGQALREGRSAKTAPREACFGFFTKRSKTSRSYRYAWTAGKGRLYVWKRDKGTIVVISVLRTSLSQ